VRRNKLHCSRPYRESQHQVAALLPQPVAVQHSRDDRDAAGRGGKGDQRMRKAACEVLREGEGDCRHGEHDRGRNSEAEPERFVQQLALAIGPAGLRDQHRDPGAHAGERDSGDELDDGAELRPERDELGPSAQSQHLVDGGSARKTGKNDRERCDELD
jgi:hypothetical protein